MLVGQQEWHLARKKNYGATGREGSTFWNPTRHGPVAPENWALINQW